MRSVAMEILESCNITGPVCSNTIQEFFQEFGLRNVDASEWPLDMILALLTDPTRFVLITRVGGDWQAWYYVSEIQGVIVGDGDGMPFACDGCVRFDDFVSEIFSVKSEAYCVLIERRVGR